MISFGTERSVGDKVLRCLKGLSMIFHKQICRSVSGEICFRFVICFLHRSVLCIKSSRFRRSRRGHEDVKFIMQTIRDVCVYTPYIQMFWKILQANKGWLSVVFACFLAWVVFLHLRFPGRSFLGCQKLLVATLSPKCFMFLKKGPRAPKSSKTFFLLSKNQVLGGENLGFSIGLAAAPGIYY